MALETRGRAIAFCGTGAGDCAVASSGASRGMYPCDCVCLFEHLSSGPPYRARAGMSRYAVACERHLARRLGGCCGGLRCVVGAALGPLCTVSVVVPSEKACRPSVCMCVRDTEAAASESAWPPVRVCLRVCWSCVPERPTPSFSTVCLHRVFPPPGRAAQMARCVRSVSALAEFRSSAFSCVYCVCVLSSPPLGDVPMSDRR